MYATVANGEVVDENISHLRIDETSERSAGVTRLAPDGQSEGPTLGNVKVNASPVEPPPERRR